MPDINDLVSFTKAAQEKRCGRNTLYRAVDDGRLNAVHVDDRQMLVKDAQYDAFEPEWTGRRAQMLEPEDESE